MSKIFKILAGLFIAKQTYDLFTDADENKKGEYDNLDYYECEMDEQGYEGDWDDD